MRGGEPQEIYREKKRVILDSSMVEHAAVNRGVVGSSPTRGVSILSGEKCHLVLRPKGQKEQGSLVKRLRHRPFTAVTRVRFP